jgi:cation diffusion facilitator CzcD-associated flavoprotein CzcO
MGTSSTDVAIVGAGPYGLSIAAHLRKRGVAFRIFGRPMRTWLDMPSGVFLKSFGFATSLSIPEPGYSFPEFCRKRGLEDFEPCTMASFSEYGLWLQKTFVPNVEEVEVTQLSPGGAGYQLTLSTGERFDARRAVVAVGLNHFARKPPFLSGLPLEVASHTSQHRDYGVFRGKDVAIVGCGQSALEAAALLHESGARPQMLVRGGAPIFYGRFNPKRSLRARLRYPNSVLGPGRTAWALEHFPRAPRYLPTARRVRMARTFLGPSGSWWLKDRVDGKVLIHTGTRVQAAVAKDSGVDLTLVTEGGGARQLHVHHLLAGTGFEFDVDSFSFLDGALRARLSRIETALVLSRHFESSERGLYFVGPISAFAYGPLFRFVAGVTYTAPTVAAHLAG